MLKTLGVLYTPELLHVLARWATGMKSRSWIAISGGFKWAQRLVRLDGAHLPAALEACMQLLTPDTFVDRPALRMMQVQAPNRFLKFSRNVKELWTSLRKGCSALEGLTREQFYERARKAYAIVYSSEPRGYGCLLLKKGVIFR
jgi:L-fucose mutarotase